DILAYVAQRQAAPAAPAAPAPPPAAPVGAQFIAPTTPPRADKEVVTPVGAQFIAPTTPVGADEEVVTPSRMRLAIAEHMVRSKRTSPHATTVVEVDMTNIAKWQERYKEDFKQREGYSISYVPFVMKAVCEGIRKFPLLNSS